MAQYRRIPDDELKRRAMEILSQALGPLAAARFAAMLERDPTDYVEVSRKLYAGETVDDILDRAMEREAGGGSAAQPQ
jgi:hypothetical protein